MQKSVRLLMLVCVTLVVGAFLSGGRRSREPVAPALLPTPTDEVQLRSENQAGHQAERMRAAVALKRSLEHALREANLFGDNAGVDYNVNIDGDVVTVGGRVTSAADRETILQTVAKVPGVSSVVDRLKLVGSDGIVIRAHAEGPQPISSVTDRPAEDSPPWRRRAKTLTSVTFVGNLMIPDWVLQLQIESRVPTPGITKGILNLKQVKEDESTLRNYYLDLGYYDFVVAHEIEYSEDEHEAQLKFVIKEGTRYRIRDIVVIGNELLLESEIRSLLTIGPGDYVDENKIGSDLAKIRKRYKEIGIKFPRVDRRYRTYDGQEGLIDLIFDIADRRELSKRIRNDENREESLDGIRDISRIGFKGVKSFDLTNLRSALATDFELIAASRPAAPVDEFLATLQSTVATGYLHGGFPDAQVKPVYHADRLHLIEVQVEEGPRYQCGDVVVTGVQQVPAEALIRSVTEDHKPQFIRWKIGGPVPFDQETAAELRKLMEVAFEEAGFYRPDFTFGIERDPNGTTARLVVNVASEGPHAVLGNVDVTGLWGDKLALHSPKDVSKFLELSPGMPFDRRLPRRLKQRLEDSGRFMVVEVEEDDVSEDPAGKIQTRHLAIRLREYEEVPPLVEPLSPAEQALLKLRGWLEQWKEGKTDDDIIVTGITTADVLRDFWNGLAERQPAGPDLRAPEPIATRIEFRIIISPRHGQIVSWVVVKEDGTRLTESVFAVYPDHLVLASLPRKTKLVLPNSVENRVHFTVSGKPTTKASGASRFAANFGLGKSRRTVAQPSPFEVRLDFATSFMLQFAHLGKLDWELQNGIHLLATEHFEFRIDDNTGRLGEFHTNASPDVPAIRVRTLEWAYQEELVRLEKPLVECAAKYDADSPIQAPVQFFLDELAFTAEQCQVQNGVRSLRALSRLMQVWSPPTTGDLLQPWLDAPAEPADPFRLPSHRPGWTSKSMLDDGSPARKSLFAIAVLPVFEKFAPRGSHLWEVGRELALQMATGDSGPINQLWTLGPGYERTRIEQFALALLNGSFNSELRAVLPQETWLQLENAVIGDGWKPYLTGDSWSARFLVSLATALPRLDDAELAHLSALVTTDENFRVALEDSLRVLRKSAADGQPLPEAVRWASETFWSVLLNSDGDEAVIPARLRDQGDASK